MRSRHTFLFVLLALIGLAATSARAQSVSPGPFFDDEQFRGYDATFHEVYYLPYFRFFTYDPGNATYIYKYDFGWLCYLGSTTPTSKDAYLYDSTSRDYFWTDVSTYPYFYSFGLQNFLYYYEDSSPRSFYSFGTNNIIVY